MSVFFSEYRLSWDQCEMQWFCNRINQLKAVADFKFEDNINFFYFVVSKSMIQINLLNWISHLLMWYFLQKTQCRFITKCVETRASIFFASFKNFYFLACMQVVWRLTLYVAITLYCPFGHSISTIWTKHRKRWCINFDGFNKECKMKEHAIPKNIL